MSNLKFILDDVLNEEGKNGLYFRVIYIKPKLFGDIHEFISSEGLKISLSYWPYICSYDRDEIYIGNGVDHLDNKDLATCIFFHNQGDRDFAKKRILNAFKELIAS